VVAACPNKAPEIFDFLMEYSKNRPIQKMLFHDIRTGQPKARKYEIDVAARMNNVFEDSLRESNLRSLRLTEHELFNILTPDKMSLLQLCMTSHILQLESFIPLLSGDKYERMLLAEHLINKVNDRNLFLGVDARGMTILHAASLLFQGSTPTRELTAQELRSKRVKTYPSLELKLLDTFFTIEGGLNSLCDRVIPLKGFPKKDPLQGVEVGNGDFPWTPMHGAIAGNNIDLLKTLIHEKQVDCTLHPYVHFLVESMASAEVCDLVITACASSSSYNTLLNSTVEPYTAKPLHLATRNSNIIVIEKLLKCSKVDPNVRDDATGLTAIHEACVRGDLITIEAFGKVSERLDLLVATDDGKTSIDIAINSRNFLMLEMLLIMRRNDVLERILHSRATENVSVLTQLELENIILAKNLGYLEKEIIEMSTVVLEENTSLIEPMNNLSITNESKISEPMDESFPDNLCEDNGGMIIDEDNMVEILQDYYCDKTADEASSISDQIVGILIKAVIEAGIVSEDFHAHICFSQGVLYKEHVTNCNKEENNCDIEENNCDIEEQ
jgi:ankyrin repeat protein